MSLAGNRYNSGKELPAWARNFQEVLDLLKSVSAKRPKTVIDPILRHGHITTEEVLKHDSIVCKMNYWASSESYQHIATQKLRRLDATRQDQEIIDYDRLTKLAKKSGIPVGEFA